MIRRPPRSTLFPYFFFNDTAATEIYTLSLHDALPIYRGETFEQRQPAGAFRGSVPGRNRLREDAAPGVADLIGVGYGQIRDAWRDRKSTRLNSSHQIISYAVFCLKKKKKK